MHAREIALLDVRSTGQNRHASNLLDEALEGGQTGMAGETMQVLVQDHLLCCASRRVIEGHFLRVGYQSLYATPILSNHTASQWCSQQD